MFTFGFGMRFRSRKYAAALATAALGAGAILATAPAAGATIKPASAPTWSITPTPATPKDGGLGTVSCTSASACTAVGTVNVNPRRTLAERWNGTTWAVQATPGVNGEMGGVSCSSASSCTAVGIRFPGAKPALAEHWNGKNWAVQATPNFSGQLFAVSCTSASACTAVGEHVNSAGTVFTLAERWNGTTWAVQKTPSPGGSGADPVLEGVSCSSASSCIAVGYYASTGPENNDVPFAEPWNGTAWATQSIPTIATYSVGITGVSCSSASACTAVGTASQLCGCSPQLAVAERWNGTTWALQTIPTPTEGGFLRTVSCSSASSCTAVGYFYYGSNMTQLTLAEHWNGTAWVIQKTPNPAGNGAVLDGVSCTSASSCMAAGVGPGATFPTTRTLAERYGS